MAILNSVNEDYPELLGMSVQRLTRDLENAFYCGNDDIPYMKALLDELRLRVEYTAFS